MSEQEEKVATRQNEIKNSINTHVLEIKNLADSLILILGKEDFKEADLDSAFDLMNTIEDQSQEIIGLLFDLRDNI